MSIHFDNSKIILEDQLKEFIQKNQKLNEQEAFNYFCLFSLLKNYNYSDKNISDSIIDDDSDIDSIMCFFDDNYITTIEELENRFSSDQLKADIKIKISQIKNSFKIDENVLEKFYTTISDIFDLNLNLQEAGYCKKFVDKAQLIREVYKKCISQSGYNLQIEVNYCCKGLFEKLSKSFKDKENKLRKVLTKISKHTINLYGAEELRISNANTNNCIIELKFDKIVTTSNGKGYIGFTKLKNYYNAITDSDTLDADGNPEFRQILFEDNAKDNQQNIEIINDIQATLLNNDERKNFWCLNNGITMIADTINYRGDRVTLYNVQIIDGLKTSYQIVKACKNNIEFTDKDFIIIKIVETDDNNLKDKIKFN